MKMKYPIKGCVAVLVGVLVGGLSWPVQADTWQAEVSLEALGFDEVQTGVMHACGHDAHMAILMGVAEGVCANTSPATSSLFSNPLKKVHPRQRRWCRSHDQRRDVGRV